MAALPMRKTVLVVLVALIVRTNAIPGLEEEIGDLSLNEGVDMAGEDGEEEEKVLVKESSINEDKQETITEERILEAHEEHIDTTSSEEEDLGIHIDNDESLMSTEQPAVIDPPTPHPPPLTPETMLNFNEAMPISPETTPTSNLEEKIEGSDEAILVEEEMMEVESNAEEEEEEKEVVVKEKREDEEVEKKQKEEEKDEGEEDVPTFTEFSQRKRMEQNSTQRSNSEKPVVSATGGQNNYASIDCGAKIIDCNKEAQNPGAILSENRDVYMINPCSADIWFIVELCELVELHSLQIACFELFSSIPENFSVFVSERYPTEDWRSLGTLRALNEREIQSFPLSVDESSYAKFLRIEMVSHYGSEHYCPLSLLRVTGASMIEVFEYSESQQEAPVEASPPPTVAPYENGGEELEDELFVSEVLQEGNVSQDMDTGSDTGIPQMLAGVVSNFIHRVSDLIGSVKNSSTLPPPHNATPAAEYSTPQTNTPSESETVLKSIDLESQPSSIQVESEFYSTEQSSPTGVSIQQETEKSTITESLSKHLSESIHSTSENTIDSVSMTTASDTISQTTPTISEIPPTPNPSATSKDEQIESASSTLQLDGTTTDPIYHTNTILVSSGSTMVPQSDNNDQTNNTTTAVSNDTALNGNDREIGESTVHEDILEIQDQDNEDEGSEAGDIKREGEEMKEEELEDEKHLNKVSRTEEMVASLDEEKDEKLDENLTTSLDHGDDIATETNRTEPEIIGDENEQKEGGEDRGEDRGGGGGGGGRGGGGGGGVGGGGGGEGNYTTTTDREGSHDPLTNGNGASVLPGQPKEKSVFLRLSNRIRDLEENMSLFSSYLDQISTGMKRNKNRTEDSYKSLERRLNLLNDSLQLLTNQTGLALAVLLELHYNTEDISDTAKIIAKQLNNSGYETLLVIGLVLLSVLILILSVSVATVVWLLCNYNSTRSQDNHQSHDSHMTSTKTTKEVKRERELRNSSSSENNIQTVTHISNRTGLLGATESMQSLEQHSDGALSTESWSRVARKRKKKPKTL